MKRSTALAISALAIANLILTACGGDDDSTSASAPAVGESADDAGEDTGAHGEDHGETREVADGAREIEVTAEDLSFSPVDITAEAGEALAVVLTSEDMLHDFTIEELDAHVAAERGKTATGGVSAEEPGTYTFYCSVPGHREAGMEGTLTVQ